MKKKINNEIKSCALEQQDILNCTADNSHVVTGIGFIGLLFMLNVALLF